jgi:hypothetical protein
LNTKVQKNTWRENRLALTQYVISELSFMDTNPNYAIVHNNGGTNVYISVSNAVSASTFDMIIPPYGTRVFAKENFFNQLFFYTEAAGGLQVYVESFSGPFDPAAIAQTQEISAAGASGLLGVINIGAFLAALPAGTNVIGNIGISSFGASLPAGSANIGGVNVLALPPLPAGTNNIGDMDIITMPGNNEGIALASAARTASIDSADINNLHGKNLIFIIDVTAAAGSPSLVFTLQGKDPASGKYYTILDSAAITVTGTTILIVSPNLAAVTNLIAQDLCPKVFRVSVAAGTADSVTYSAGYINI